MRRDSLLKIEPRRWCLGVLGEDLECFKCSRFTFSDDDRALGRWTLMALHLGGIYATGFGCTGKLTLSRSTEGIFFQKSRVGFRVLMQKWPSVDWLNVDFRVQQNPKSGCKLHLMKMTFHLLRTFVAIHVASLTDISTKFKQCLSMCWFVCFGVHRNDEFLLRILIITSMDEVKLNSFGIKSDFKFNIIEIYWPS